MTYSKQSYQRRDSLAVTVLGIAGILLILVISIVLWSHFYTPRYNPGSLPEDQCVVSKGQTVEILAQSRCIDIMEQYFRSGYKAVATRDGVVVLSPDGVDKSGICVGQCK